MKNLKETFYVQNQLLLDLLAGKDVESKTNLGCAATCALKKIGLVRFKKH